MWGCNIMKDSFPVDFYAVSATVIPVLFLALLVQDTGLKLMAHAAKTYFDDIAQGHPRPVTRPMLLIITATIGLVYGVVGEVIALNELLNQGDSMTSRTLVFLAVVLLLIGVASIPVFAIYGPLFREFKAIRRRQARKENDKPETPAE
jgi:uncharacterized sodium:solute symporter family permease YidK